MAKKKEQLEWKVNTPSLLQEILNNKGASILHRPLQIFGALLEGVAHRASELNDPELNHLMCRLALYEICDPFSKKYDAKVVRDLHMKSDMAKMKRNKEGK
jgi:hypothetical protein